MMRVVACLLLMLSLAAPAALSEPRARDSALASSAVMAARDPSDACGGRGLLDKAVPNGVFLDACRFHDACYRSGALDQGRCDSDFLRDMQTACDTEFAGMDKAGLNAACRVKAYTYFRAVNSRVGALLYPGATTGGRLDSVQQRLTNGDSGAPHLEVCAEVTNTANRKLRYVLTLHDARGQWVATAPIVRSAALQPGETRALCTGTKHAWFRNAESLGPAYALTLKVDNPDTLNPFGDLASLDRVDCVAATGNCRQVDP